MKNHLLRTASLLVAISTVSVLTSGDYFSAAEAQIRPVERERIPRTPSPEIVKPPVVEKLPNIKPVEQMFEIAPPPTQVGTANPGDILVVLMGPNTVKTWSFPTTGGSAVNETKTVKAGLNVNAEGAKGVYISFINDAPLPYGPKMYGTLQINNASGNESDSPVVYVSSSDRALKRLQQTNNVVLMQSFHQKSVAAGNTVRTMAQTWGDDFAQRVRSHVVDSVQAAQGYLADGEAVVDTSRAPQGAPGSAIENLLTAMQSDIETHTDDVIAKGNAISGFVPDVDSIMRDCERELVLIENQIEAIAAADDVEDAADEEQFNNNGGGPDSDDKLNDGQTPNREDALDDIHEHIEKCFYQALDGTENLTPADVPIPSNDEAQYLGYAADAEALRDQIYAAAEAFRQQMEDPSVEQSLILSEEDELGLQRDILSALKPIDSTGEISATLATISTGFASVLNFSKSGQVIQKAGTTKTGEQICKGATNAPLLDLSFQGFGLIIGSPMADKINGRDSIDIVLGLDGDDCIKTGKKIDIAFGMKGDDFIDGGEHHDFLIGNRGDDFIQGGDGKQYTIGTNVVDVGNLLDGGGGSDTIHGWGVTSNYIGKKFTDVIFGDGLAKPNDHGDDHVDGTGGINFILGQRGNDDLTSHKEGDIVINGAPIQLGSFFFGLRGDDKITGSPSLDIIFGSEDDDTIAGGKASDFILGNIGDDEIDGENGMDFLFGGLGDDKVEGGKGGLIDIDVLFGGQDDDRVTDLDGLLTLAFGNEDNDTLYGRGRVGLVMGNLGEDFAHGGPIFSLVFGGIGNDKVVGGRGVSAINIASGDQGDDFVFGGRGLASLMLGGQGNDYMRGDNPYKLSEKDGADILLGGIDSDWLDGAGGPDVSFGGTGEDVVKGGDWDASNALPNINLSIGGLNDDCVYGEGLADMLLGNGGEDFLYGHGAASLHLGLVDDDQHFGSTAGHYLTNIDLVFGDGNADRMNLGKGPDLVFGMDGDDHIRSEGILLAFGGKGDDRIASSGPSSIMFGNKDTDHIEAVGTPVPGTNEVFHPFSAIFGNDDNDFTKGGTFGFGNGGNDHMSAHRASFGAEGEDTIRTRDNMFIPLSAIFGGKDNDIIKTSLPSATAPIEPRSFIFGGKGDDRVIAREGKNRVWGGQGDDKMDSYLVPSNGDPDKKDKLRGGWGGSDEAWGDDDTKDKLRNAEKERASSGMTLASPTSPLAPNVPIQACPIGTSAGAYIKSARGIGGTTDYQPLWMDDYGQ